MTAYFVSVVITYQLAEGSLTFSLCVHNNNNNNNNIGVMRYFTISGC
jgi:hypothetical protein